MNNLPFYKNRKIGINIMGIRKLHDNEQLKLKNNYVGALV
jgi:hypothetical protein